MVALRAADAPVAPVAALDAALVDVLDGAARAARAATDAAARASNDAPTLGPPADDGGAVDALEAFVERFARRAAHRGALEVVTAASRWRRRRGRAGRGAGRPGRAGRAGRGRRAGRARRAHHVRGRRAHGARRAARGTRPRWPRRALTARPARRARRYAPRWTRLLMRRTRLARRRTTSTRNCRLPPLARACTRRTFTTAAAVVTRAALVGCVVDDTLSCRDARALLEAALPACNAIVGRRCEVVIRIYDGDGGRFGGHKEHENQLLHRRAALVLR